MYPHFIEVHDKDTDMKLSFNIDKITVVGDQTIETDREGFEVVETYDELKKLIFDAGCIIARKDPRLEDRPLTMDDLMTMVGEPVWDSDSRKWALIKEVREDEVTLVYKMADWVIVDDKFISHYPLYRMRTAA